MKFPEETPFAVCIFQAMSKHLHTLFYGAAVGALATLCVQSFKSWWQRQCLYNLLQLEAKPRSGERININLGNGYVVPLTGVRALITITHEKDDIKGQKDEGFINSENYSDIKDEQLCWSTTMPELNPPTRDIYAGEVVGLDIADFGNGTRIEIPSEQGWSSEGKTPRAFLRWDKYDAFIKIVSRETKAKVFKIRITPNDPKPIEVVRIEHACLTDGAFDTMFRKVKLFQQFIREFLWSGWG